MPHYVLNRTYTHRSTTGVVSFVKGEPTWVIPAMEKEVVAIGAECVDGEKPELLEPKPAEVAPLSIHERKEMLFLAFEQIVKKNDSKEFTGQGVPTAKAVEKIVGFDTDRLEITEAWAEYKAEKAEQ